MEVDGVSLPLKIKVQEGAAILLEGDEPFKLSRNCCVVAQPEREPHLLMAHQRTTREFANLGEARLQVLGP